MDAVKFLKEKNRMHEMMKGNCEKCGLSYANNEMRANCIGLFGEYPEKAVEIVEQWAKERPRKTRQSELLKIFPNAHRWGNFINICPRMIENFDCPQKQRVENWMICAECKGQFWNEVVD